MVWLHDMPVPTPLPDMRHGWERQKEITVHKIYLIVAKGIIKDSGSV
jgi:hypothetical protein